MTVNGTSAADTIAVARGVTNDTVQVGALQALTVVNANVQALLVATGAGADTVNVTGTAGPSLTISGGQVPASDILNITNTATGATTVTPGTTSDAGIVASVDGIVNFAGMKAISVTAAGSTDSLTILGTNGNDAITSQTLGGKNIAWVNAQAPVTFAGFNVLNLNGRFGNDTYTVAPVGIVMAGVSPTINVNGTAGANNLLTVNGSGAADNINYSPTAADAGKVAILGSAALVFTKVPTLAFNGQGGGDNLTVTTPSASTVTLAPAARRMPARCKLARPRAWCR